MYRWNMFFLPIRIERTVFVRKLIKTVTSLELELPIAVSAMKIADRVNVNTHDTSSESSKERAELDLSNIRVSELLYYSKELLYTCLVIACKVRGDGDYVSIRRAKVDTENSLIALLEREILLKCNWNISLLNWMDIVQVLPVEIDYDKYSKILEQVLTYNNEYCHHLVPVIVLLSLIKEQYKDWTF